MNERERSDKRTGSISGKKYIIVLFLTSAPFWLLGGYASGLSRFLPAGLPISALQFVCPLLTVVILGRFTMTPGDRKLLWYKVVHLRGLHPWRWYLPALLVMPLAIAASIACMKLLGWHVPAPQVDLVAVALVYLVYLVAAIGEEVGWTIYLTDALQSRYGALGAAVAIGSIWSVWHFIPWAQGGHTLNWILAQGAVTLLGRIFIVWIYNNSGRSIVSAVLFHASMNAAELFPTNGPSLYHPEVTAVVLAIGIGLFIWKYSAKTLSGPQGSLVIS